MIVIQLEKLVKYYKALADRNRIRILILLSAAKAEMNGMTLADKLGVTPATITHHIAKLKEVGLVVERRDKNNIYYGISLYLLQTTDGALVKLINQHKEADEMNPAVDKNEKLRDSVLNNFFAEDGTLKQIPAQLKKKLIVFEFLIRRLEIGKKYTEKEINAFIKNYHPDFATIRREFIMHQYMYRENEIYELNPSEMWAKWQQLS